MQFILTLLISVRGRKLRKDGSDLSYSEKAVCFDRRVSCVWRPQPAWTQGPGTEMLGWLGTQPMPCQALVGAFHLARARCLRGCACATPSDGLGLLHMAAPVATGLQL